MQEYTRQPRTTDGYRYALQRIRSEYLEMPGMRLTVEQLHRLTGVDMSTCRRVLDDLVRARFLHRAADGAYLRFADESVA